MVGSSNTDLVARVPRLPHHGECLTGTSFEIGFGGKGANQAIIAARLGAQVAVVTRLGRDVFGEAYARRYRDENIDTRFIAFDDMRSSGAALILVDEPTGLNTMAFIPGANAGLSLADARVAGDSIAASHVLLCQLEVPVETTLEAFRIAHATGAHRPLTLLNTAPVPVPRDPLPHELLELTDILVANEEEAAFLAEMPVDTIEQAMVAATTLAARWSCASILTLGGRGVAYVERDGIARHVAAPQVQAVDTTGAGDAFVGSLAFLVASGEPLPLAVERATQVATLTVLDRGTQASFPTRAHVRERLGW